MKQLIILHILFTICLQGWNQKSIKTETACTDEMAQLAKGRWIKTADIGSYNTNETSTRLNKIQDMILNIYPQPTGVDVEWHRSAGVSYFGSKRKYYKTNDDRLTFDYSNLPHSIQYAYTAGFFRYQCEYNKTNSLLPGSPGETGTWLNVIANTSLGEPGVDDSWTINGMPVIMQKPVSKSLDGIEFLYPEAGRNVKHVLVHRKNVLPYIQVSRKQYLDHCIIYYTKLWDDVIKGFEQMIADKKQRDEQIEKARKNKEDVLKKFTDEQERSRTDGLLDSPAMVLVKYYPDPIFETDPEKGLMLVTENPDYLKKELAKHVPQLFIVTWIWNDWESQRKIGEIIEQKFPFEKLQAMIDK